MDISRFLNFKDRWQLTKDVILWLACGTILLIVFNLLGILPLKLPDNIYFPESIKIATFFLILILLFVLFKDFWKWVGIIRNKNKIYIFHSKDWPDKWIFNGKTELTDNAYLFIKSSRAGCLLKNYYWKDFKISFEMKFSPDNFRKQKLLGLVFRAADLDNYFMIEIGENAERFRNLNNQGDEEGPWTLVSSIKPHIRYKGGWEIMSVEEITPSFDFSDFVKVSLEVKGDTVHLFYKNNSIFNWMLPTYVDVNHIESGVEDNREKTKSIVVGGPYDGHVQKIPFRLDYGLVGFRAYMKHGAIIRDLKIEPL